MNNNTGTNDMTRTEGRLLSINNDISSSQSVMISTGLDPHIIEDAGLSFFIPLLTVILFTVLDDVLKKEFVFSINSLFGDLATVNPPK